MKSSLRTENSWHFTAPPLVSREYNYVWETNAGTLYWWCVTTQIWVVHLIGWSKFSTNQKHHSDLGSDALSVWNFCADVISGGNQWWRLKMSAVFPGYGKSWSFKTTSTYHDFFRGETSGGVSKCGLFSRAMGKVEVSRQLPRIMISLKLSWKDKMWDCLLTTLLEEIVMALPSRQ